MRLNQIDMNGLLPVDGYGPGFFRVAGAVHRGGIAILPSGLRAWGGMADRAELIAAAAGQIDVLFVGTGAEIAPLDESLRAEADAAGIMAEAMASPAACRTFNILLSEGRRVGLAALPV